MMDLIVIGLVGTLGFSILAATTLVLLVIAFAAGLLDSLTLAIRETVLDILAIACALIRFLLRLIRIAAYVSVFMAYASLALVVYAAFFM